MALNRFELIGRLTKDPEIRETPQGTKVATLNIAQTKKWKDQSGTKQEKSLFFQFKAWGKQAEIFEQYTAKGSQLWIAAEVEPYETEKDGVKKYGAAFTVRDFEFIGSAKKKEGLTEGDVDQAFPDDLPY